MEKLIFYPRTSDTSRAIGEINVSRITLSFRVSSNEPGTRQEENNFARRLVASYNACLAIPIELLESESAPQTLGNFYEKVAEIDLLKAVNAQLRQSLEFYADDKTYEQYYILSTDTHVDSKIEGDRGYVAKMALEGITEQDIADTLPDEPTFK